VVNEEPACDPSVIFLVLLMSDFMLPIDDLTVRWDALLPSVVGHYFAFSK
jgi:hypothetical protein